MAADRFYFTSLEARSMSFPCCNQSLFWRFRFPPLHSHAFRLSPPKPKFNSKCSISNSDSVSADLVIHSATECSDGSVIFRFRSASEIAIIEDQTKKPNQSAKVVVKVGGKDLDKEDKSSFKEVGETDGEAETLEPVKKKVGRNLQAISSLKRKVRQNATKVTEVVKAKGTSVVSDDREIDEKTVYSSKDVNPKEGSDELVNVIKKEDDNVSERNGEASKNEGSSVVLNQDLVPLVEKVSPPLAASVVESEITTQLSSSESGSKVEVLHGVMFQEENKGASKGSDEDIGKMEDTALNVVSKMDLVPDIEKASPQLEASVIENGIAIAIELASLESGSKSEVPHSVRLEEEENTGAEENGDRIGKTEGTTLNVESTTNLAPDIERDSPLLEAEAIESKITTELASLESSSKNEVPHSVKLEEEENTGAEENAESIGKIEGTILNMESKVNLVPDIKRASPTLAADAIESEITTELASLESSSKNEVPHSVKLEEEENTVAEEDGESIGKIEGSILNMESKVNLVSDIEWASPTLATDAVESEITTELASLESSSKNEVPHSVKLEEEENTGAEEDGERIGKGEATTLNMESKTDLVPDIEKASPPLEAAAIESEVRTELSCLEPSSKSEVPHSVNLEEEDNSGDEGNGERIAKIEGATSIMESKMDLAVEEVCAQVAASENSIGSEIKIQTTSLGACTTIEVPRSLDFQESGKDDAGVAKKSAPSEEHGMEHSINASKTLVLIEDADEGDVGEVELNSTLSEVESILSEATVHETLGKSVDSDMVKSSKMTDEGVPFSFSKEEITENDAESGKKVRVPMLKGIEFQSDATALEREEISTAGFFLYSGAALLPDSTKAFAGGEDAYFIACQNWLGVADGVGQWSLEGVSVGVYAKELMENCERIVSDRNEAPITDPVEVLNRAAANTQSSGSSTVLVAYFDDRALHVANIGDSGFMIIRNGVVFKRSSPMVYELNFPVQIKRGDSPSDFVEVYSVDLDESDVIITATDGLFDNLYEKDIASVVIKSLQKNLKPKEIAELLASLAREVGQLSLVRSPFSDEVQAAGYVGYRGNKLDDVTVIVSLVKRRFSNHIQS